MSLKELSQLKVSEIPGVSLDRLDIETHAFRPDPQLLKWDSHENKVEEELYSDLLKSNCLVTGQPDWGSVYIRYSGRKISQESLLKFIISFRNHNEFHEQCVERIFQAIWTQLTPEKLQVQAFYTRRGGLDINPCRINGYADILELRTVRQ